MISLIKNEFVKIFKKKGIYITLLIVFAFVILINVMMKYADGMMMNVTEGYAGYDQNTEQELARLNPDSSQDIGQYLDLKTYIDMCKLTDKYGVNTWQAYILGNKVYQYVYDINKFTYGSEKNEENRNKAQEVYNKIIEKLDNNDWKFFANEELEEAKARLSDLQKQREVVIDTKTLADLDRQIFDAELQKEVAEMRIAQDIQYGNDYLNSALFSYQGFSLNIKDYEEDIENQEYEQKQVYYGNLADVAEAKYMIENKVNLDKADARTMLKDSLSQYSLFIVIIIVMIAGSLVSDEFSKGTIKLLLVRPHSRTKILLAKFLTSMIMILLAIIIVLIMQVIVGGIVFGFGDLMTDIMVYDFNIKELVSMNVFEYLFIQILARLPFFMLIATIAFAVSTIFTNTAMSITIALLGFFAGDIINVMVYNYNIEFMKYFITMNWNLNEYLFGNLPMLEYMNFNFSAIMCVLYFIAMIIPTFIIFKKKNIKNI